MAVPTKLWSDTFGRDVEVTRSEASSSRIIIWIRRPDGTEHGPIMDWKSTGTLHRCDGRHALSEKGKMYVESIRHSEPDQFVWYLLGPGSNLKFYFKYAQKVEAAVHARLIPLGIDVTLFRPVDTGARKEDAIAKEGLEFYTIFNAPEAPEILENLPFNVCGQKELETVYRIGSVDLALTLIEKYKLAHLVSGIRKDIAVEIPLAEAA